MVRSHAYPPTQEHLKDSMCNLSIEEAVQVCPAFVLVCENCLLFVSVFGFGPNVNFWGLRVSMLCGESPPQKNPFVCLPMLAGNISWPLYESV